MAQTTSGPIPEGKFNIAIDGPAGAGKSTIARRVAKEAGYIYVDTGAMYRAMALFLLRKGITADLSESDPAAFHEKVAAACEGAQITIEYQGGEQVVLLNGENVNSYLRTEEVSRMASGSSAIPKVRAKLLELQQHLAETSNVVMDGRDIGTVVLPNADVKVYLTASAGVRARRRYLENLEAKKSGRELSPDDLDPAKIEEDITKRDHDDMTRKISPLRQAPDATLVDSSDLTIDQVVEAILNLVAVKKGRPQVITARTAGFCFGVEKAVNAVYDEANQAENGAGSRGSIVTYGPIIHNEVVVEDLKKRGVGVINDPSEIREHADGTIVIRSHGVPKALYDEIKESGARVVDTTCTFVKRIHEIVERESAAGHHIVIIGNHGHAEVEGTKGWCADPVNHPATVIETMEEAKSYNEDKTVPICVVAQTTFNGAKFEELVKILEDRGYLLTVNNTICNATRERQQEARDIAEKADIMIVIGGKGSSNTAKLYDICSAVCGRTYFIQTVDDLHLDLLRTDRIIGITAGASTPKNIIEEVQSYVRRADF